MVDEPVRAARNARPQQWPDPVDPMVSSKPNNDARSETARGIETSSGEEDAA